MEEETRLLHLTHSSVGRRTERSLTKPCQDRAGRYSGCQPWCPFKQGNTLLPGCVWYVDKNRRGKWLLSSQESA